jgi:dienelactone hydrolase
MLFFVFLVPPWLAGARASELTERVLKVPVKLEDMYRKVIEREITVTVFQQAGGAPYPLMVLSHGRAPDSAGRQNLGRARYSEASTHFASLGYSVWVPTRIGYGVSGTDLDPENSGACGSMVYPPAYAAAAEQVLQVIAYAKQLPEIDGTRIVSVGQSFGGATSIALAARNPAGLVAAVNFAGGGAAIPGPVRANPASRSGWRRCSAATAERPHPHAVDLRRERPLLPAVREKLARGIPLAGRPRGAGPAAAFGEDGHLLFVRGMAVWQPSSSASSSNSFPGCEGAMKTASCSRRNRPALMASVSHAQTYPNRRSA